VLLLDTAGITRRQFVVLDRLKGAGRRRCATASPIIAAAIPTVFGPASKEVVHWYD
jgi:hypothetical protein